MKRIILFGLMLVVGGLAFANPVIPVPQPQVTTFTKVSDGIIVRIVKDSAGKILSAQALTASQIESMARQQTAQATEIQKMLDALK